jgi:hypothetical protein
MITPIDKARATGRRTPPGRSAHTLHCRPGLEAVIWDEKKNGQVSAQPIEKAGFGQADPSQSKGFPLIFFAPAWPDFARF